MKIIAWRDDAGRHYGAVDGGHVQGLVGELDSLVPDGSTRTLESIGRLDAPVRPGKIICVGLNYLDHAKESGLDLPERPALFMKATSAVIGMDDAIVLPSLSTDIDYEAELGVVIGRVARNVSVAGALDHVLGYTCVNDVSARDLQAKEGFGWVRGKSLDTFCPVGPVLVTTDEIPDPQALSIVCRVNGETLQDSSTSEMIFSVAEIISFISAGLTLMPGDLIATGTPSGVGMAHKPAKWLRDGDVVEVELSGIGCLRNTVRGATQMAQS